MRSAASRCISIAATSAAMPLPSSRRRAAKARSTAIPAGTASEIALAHLRLEPLDGVTEHGARHVRRMLVEEGPQQPLVPLAHLAQHPAAGLVDEVVLVAEQAPGDGQGVVEVVVADEVLRGHHGDAALPQ